MGKASSAPPLAYPPPFQPNPSAAQPMKRPLIHSPSVLLGNAAAGWAANASSLCADVYCDQLMLQFALAIETVRVGSAPIDVLLNNAQPAAPGHDVAHLPSTAASASSHTPESFEKALSDQVRYVLANLPAGLEAGFPCPEQLVPATCPPHDLTACDDWLPAHLLEGTLP